MAIRLLSDGTFEFDTVAEAVEFQKMSQAQNGAPKARKASSRAGNAIHKEESAPLPVGVGEFMTKLEGDQKRLVKVLAGAEGELTTRQLGEEAGIKGGAIGPLLRHVRDNADRCGIARDFITTRKIPRGPEGKQVSYYALIPEIKGRIIDAMQQ